MRPKIAEAAANPSSGFHQLANVDCNSPRKNNSSPKPATTEIKARSRIVQGRKRGVITSSENRLIEAIGPTGQRKQAANRANIGKLAARPQRLASVVSSNCSQIG